MTYPSQPTRDPETGERVEPVAGRPVVRARVPGYVRMIQLIWFLAGLVDVLVALRFVLKLFGASLASPFVTLVYNLTAPLVRPFRDIFPVSGSGAFVFEPAALVALVIYPLIALGAVSLTRILSERRTVAT
jgi:YggT family protein